MNVEFVKQQLQQLLANTGASNRVVRDKFLIQTAMNVVDRFDKESRRLRCVGLTISEAALRADRKGIVQTRDAARLHSLLPSTLSFSVENPILRVRFPSFSFTFAAFAPSKKQSIPSCRA